LLIENSKSDQIIYYPTLSLPKDNKNEF
jgi:hypothetical protein